MDGPALSPLCRQLFSLYFSHLVYCHRVWLHRLLGLKAIHLRGIVRERRRVEKGLGGLILIPPNHSFCHSCICCFVLDIETKMVSSKHLRSVLFFLENDADSLLSQSAKRVPCRSIDARKKRRYSKQICRRRRGISKPSNKSKKEKRVRGWFAGSPLVYPCMQMHIDTDIDR